MQRASEPVTPLALYVDAAQYLKRDSVIVFVCCNLLSGTRHLSAILRKKELCNCGCRGHCSIRPVLEMLRWSFAALATGAFPAVDHMGKSWGQQDEGRAALAGLPLSLTAAVVQVKGDLG